MVPFIFPILIKTLMFSVPKQGSQFDHLPYLCKTSGPSYSRSSVSNVSEVTLVKNSVISGDGWGHSDPGKCNTVGCCSGTSNTIVGKFT